MPKRPRRNKRIDAPYVRLYRWMLDSPAYLLSCQARAVLIEIASSHDGTNNGRLGLSVRRASERCNITRYGATCFGRNQDGGFVDCMTNGAFQPEGTARRANVPIAVSIEGTHIVYHRA